MCLFVGVSLPGTDWFSQCPFVLSQWDGTHRNGREPGMRKLRALPLSSFPKREDRQAQSEAFSRHVGKRAWRAERVCSGTKNVCTVTRPPRLVLWALPHLWNDIPSSLPWSCQREVTSRWERFGPECADQCCSRHTVGPGQGLRESGQLSVTPPVPGVGGSGLC